MAFLPIMKNWLIPALLGALGSLAMIFWMVSQGTPLKIPSLEIGGQITLELAGSPDRVAIIIAAWKEKGVLEVIRENIIIDYLFLLAYSFFLFAGYRRLHVLNPSTYGLHKTILAIWAFTPGLIDAIENQVMLAWLRGDNAFVSPGLLRIFVIIKFVMALLLAFVVLGGFLNFAFQKLMRR
jgi:hypothetical protein